MRAPLSLSHRGFVLTIHATPAAGAACYGYAVWDGAQRLHSSGAAFRTAASADRAARCHVDDALGAYAAAQPRLAGAA